VDTKTAKIWRTVSDAVLGKPELSGAEVAERAGVPVEEARRFWQALGFPAVASDERIFTRRDADVLRFAFQLIEEGELDPAILLGMARASGQALARVANMHVSSVAERIETVMRQRELSSGDAADIIATLAESVVRGHESFLGYIWRRHLLAAISQIVASADGRTGGGGEIATVGFADLVDYTAVTRLLSERELTAMVDRFERIAYQHIPDRGGRVIKTLGDEVMYSHASPRAAADIALDLVAACHADDLLPDVRIGLAVGPVLAWEGDLYGSIVNLASRLVGVARPGTVLVSDDLAQRLENDETLTVREIPAVKLKGIGRTRPSVLRRRAVAAERVGT
jgi:adenylate cyclase